MQFGVFMFGTDFSMNVIELGRAAEARGFESFWAAEHTHIPASRRTPYPRGGDLPPEYSHLADPFVVLGAVAGVTSRIKLGTGVCLIPERDPILLAKSVASLDHISNGRFLFGIGGGWNREEMENHGADPKTRWRLTRDRILAMKAIWTQDEAEYHGEFVNFDKIWQWPKPVQKPHPPILMGGDAPTTFDRVLDYGDEWMPVAARSVRSLGFRIEELNRRAAEIGRGPIPVSPFGISPDTHAEVLEEYAKLGVRRCVYTLPPAKADVILPVLDRLAKVIETYA